MEIEAILTGTFLIPLVIVGLTAIYWDIKKNQIPNKLILSGFIFGTSLHLIWLIYGFFYLQNSSYLNFFLAGFLNGTFSFLLGYSLWRLKFWSPGDGKLFAIYGFLFPITLYSEFYLDYFPAYLLLINLAVLFLIVATIRSILHLAKKRRKILNKLTDPSLYKKENIKKIAKESFNFTIVIATAMVFITGISKAGEFIFGFRINAFIVIGLLLVFVNLFQKLKKKYPETRYLQHLVLIFYFGRFIALGDFIGLIMALRVIFIFLIIAGLFRKLLRLYVKSKEIKEIRVEDVEEGMVLSRQWKKYFGEKLKDFKSEDRKTLFNESQLAGGLTKKQAEFIRHLFREDQKYKIEVCKTFPFAPYIFASALIIVINGGMYIHAVNDIFMNLLGY